jgi:phosphate transport system substrate-binding protein
VRFVIGTLVLLLFPFSVAAQERLTVYAHADVIERLSRLEEVVSRWHPDLKVDWMRDNSGVSFSPLFDGSADVLLTLRCIEPWERALAGALSIEIHEHAAALEAVSVVVHPDNQVGSLTLEQAQTLFSGGIVGWYGFGGSDRPIRLLVPSPSSGEYQALQRISPGGDFRAPLSAEVAATARQVAILVASDPRAVGLVPAGLEAPGLREVPLSASASSPPIEPSVDSVESGEYPWSQVLWLYRREGADETLRRLISCLLSTEGQRELTKAGFAPLPADRPFLRTLGARERSRAAKVTRVSFASGLDRLDEASRDLLSRAAREVKEVWITGHAELREDRAGAVGLSERRARAVEAFLAGLGVAVRRAEGVGADGGDRSAADVWWISRR